MYSVHYIYIYIHTHTSLVTSFSFPPPTPKPPGPETSGLQVPDGLGLLSSFAIELMVNFSSENSNSRVFVAFIQSLFRKLSQYIYIYIYTRQTDISEYLCVRKRRPVFRRVLLYNQMPKGVECLA